MATQPIQNSDKYYLELTDGIKNQDGSWAKQPTLKELKKEEWESLEKQLKALAKRSDGRTESDVDQITQDRVIKLTEIHDFLDIDQGDGFKASDLAKVVSDDFGEVNNALKKQGVYLTKLIDGYDTNRSEVLEIAKENGLAAEFFNPYFQKDREIENVAVNENKMAITYFREPSEENILKSLEDGYQGFEAVLKNPKNSSEYKEGLLKNEKFLTEAIILQPKLIGLLKDEKQISLKLYNRLALQAVEEEGDTIELLRNPLQTNPKYLIAAALTYPKAAAYATVEQKEDPEFVIDMLEVNGTTLQYFPLFQDNEDYVIAAGTEGFPYAYKKLQAKPEIYKPAVIERGELIKYVPDEHVTKDLVLKALRGRATLDEIPAQFQNDRDVILARIRYKSCFGIESDGSRTKNDDFKIIEKVFEQWGKKEGVKFYSDVILINHGAAMEMIPASFRNEAFKDAIKKLESEWKISFPPQLLDIQAVDQYGHFIAKLSEMNINYPERIRSLRYLAYVIQDKTSPRSKTESIAGRVNLFWPRDDHNHAFLGAPVTDWLLEDLEKQHPVKPGERFSFALNYREFKTTREWIEAHDPNSPADYGVEGGHGFKGQYYILSGKESQKNEEVVHRDLFNDPAIRSRFTQSYKTGAQLFMFNCSAGKSREHYKNNLINVASQFLRNGNILGYDQDGNVRHLSVKPNGQLYLTSSSSDPLHPPPTPYFRDTRFSLEETVLIHKAKQQDSDSLAKLGQFLTHTPRGKEVLKLLIGELEDPQKQRKTALLLGEIAKHPELSKIISDATLTIYKKTESSAKTRNAVAKVWSAMGAKAPNESTELIKAEIQERAKQCKTVGDLLRSAYDQMAGLIKINPAEARIYLKSLIIKMESSIVAEWAQETLAKKSLWNMV